MRVVHDAGVFLRFVGSQQDRRPWPDLRGDGDHGQRKDDAHAEDGNQDTPSEESLLPFRRHVLEFVGIHNRIVEG